MDWGKIATTVGVKVASKLLGGSSSKSSSSTDKKTLDVNLDFEDMRTPQLQDEVQATQSVNYNDIVSSWTNGIYTYGKK